jgi:prephenate dehydratase
MVFRSSLPRESFSPGPRNNRRRLIVGVLGPEHTSTHVAARFLGQQLEPHEIAVEFVFFPNFETERDSLDRAEIGLAVVPAAYQYANDFFFERNFKLVGHFQFPTPAYGLVMNDAAFQGGNRLLVTHPAPRRLVPDIVTGICDPCDIEVRFVTSTSIAAKRVADGDAAFGITNAEAAIEFGLPFVREFRPVTMVWLLFGRTDNDLGVVSLAVA